MHDLTIGEMKQQLVHIQQTLRDHGEVLRLLEKAIGELNRVTLAAASKTSSSGGKPGLRLLSRLRNTSPFVQSLAAGVLMWTSGLCIAAYLRRGGDPMALLELIAKSVL